MLWPSMVVAVIFFLTGVVDRAMAMECSRSGMRRVILSASFRAIERTSSGCAEHYRRGASMLSTWTV